MTVVEVVPPPTLNRSPSKIRAEAHVAKMTPAPGHTRFVLEVTKPTTESAVGVKMTADRGGGLISVLEAVPGSLAEAAGLKAGDVLVEIDGAAAPATVGECGKMLRAHEAGPLCFTVDRVVPPPSVPPPKPPPKPPPPKPVRVELSVVKTMKSQKLGITLWEDKPGFISVQAVAAGSVVEAAGIRVGDVVVGIGGKAAPSTVHGCILKLKAAEGTCVVAVTRKGAAAAEEIKAQSVRRASQVAAAAAAREAHIRTLKAKRMSELTKDLSAYNAARAQAIADEVEAIYTGKVRERMEGPRKEKARAAVLVQKRARGNLGRAAAQEELTKSKLTGLYTRLEEKSASKIQAQFRAAEVSKQASRELDEVLAPATSETEDAEIEAAAAAVRADAERRLSRRASRQGFSPAPGVASPVRVASPPPVGSFAPPPDAPRPTPSKPLKELVATISKELGLAPGLSLSAALAEAARLMGVEPTGTLPQQAAVLVAAISGA